ncbi:hypothetical protein D0T25_05275 [Duganella sp. BJB488]|nr:hypothetical protein D0T26_05315 [Duganella sp. BJB489]RFP26790.1 hypothetical protein D0T25_05275 [Duganella sp. BJB488]RFP34477.1 hypothetical protein D0T24_12755 [Duganella sp. BJB480]
MIAAPARLGEAAIRGAVVTGLQPWRATVQQDDGRGLLFHAAAPDEGKFGLRGDFHVSRASLLFRSCWNYSEIAAVVAL